MKLLYTKELENYGKKGCVMLRLYLVFKLLFIAFISILLSSCSYHYGEPPETSDPWELIRNARMWINEGRPRGALPSINKALEEIERLDKQSIYYKHTKAAVYNEKGRIFILLNELNSAEKYLNEAYKLSLEVGYRALQFDINYNLSTLYDMKNDTRTACNYLTKVKNLYEDLYNNPADSPDGYGTTKTKEFLENFARSRINNKSNKMNCNFQIQ